MEIKENKVIFEIDDKAINSLKLSLNIIGKNPDEAFLEWIYTLNNKALKTMNNEISSSSTLVGGLSKTSLPDKLDNSVVQSRIQRWARNKDGFAYKMIKVFLELYNSNKEHIVKREQLRNVYTERYLLNKSTASTDIFIITFRQMCSDASRAYGLIFKYNNDNGEDEVILHPLNERLILNLSKEF